MTQQAQDSAVDHRAQVPPEQLRKATLAASVGSALEYYDFALYGTASALIFGKLFFPAFGVNQALILSFATYAIGFLARPLGGLFFGMMGDRLGRKWVLTFTIAIMGLSSTFVGLLPTAATIGVWAPTILVVLRLLQGFGAGAEQAGATVLMAEYSPTKKRGFFSALPFVGIQAGTLLAAAVWALLGLAPDEVLYGWLWRVPFLASIVLIALALFIRLRLRESPTFVELEKQEQIAEHPLPELFRTARRQVWRGIGLRMGENGGSYLFSTLSITFVTSSAVGLGKSIGPLAVAVASGIGILTVPLAGALSDRFGRIPVYRSGAAFLTLLAWPAWYLLSLGNPALVVLVVVLGVSLGVNTMLGAQCAMLPELFGNRHRYIGVAVSREFSAVIAGGAAPLLGVWFLSMTDYSWWPLGLYTFVLGLITVVSTFITPETRARTLTRIEDVPLAGTQNQRGAA
ncbi:MFS transporter [Kribbella sp. NPDC050820]|uniref:MFS transporter n=1 Tax=Kribbella sp. NPDC050820 TaxID=3155408 RepID=UPI003408D097